MEVRFSPHELRRAIDEAIGDCPLLCDELSTAYLRRVIVRAMERGADLFAKIAADEARRLELDADLDFLSPEEVARFVEDGLECCANKQDLLAHVREEWGKGNMADIEGVCRAIDGYLVENPLASPKEFHDDILVEYKSKDSGAREHEVADFLEELLRTMRAEALLAR